MPLLVQHRTGQPRTALLLGVLLGVLAGTAQAQVRPDTLLAEPDIEAILDDFEDEAGNPTELVELLATLAENPIDINAASAAELAQIPWIGPVLAQAIARYRDEHGLFGSIPELIAIDGFTEDVFVRSRPYLRIGSPSEVRVDRPRRYPPPPALGEILRAFRFEAIQRVTRRLDLGRGYDDDTLRTTYTGTPERLYTRLRARSGRHVVLNVTLEKDPGERFAWSPSTATYGYDHVAAHLALEDFGRIRRLIVGDFSANFGQGVALWSNSAFGKGREPVRPMIRSGRGLRPYGSTDENRFFRGLGLSVALTPQFALSTFASRRTLDASLTQPDTLIEDPLAIRSFDEDGLHRTPTEQAQKDAVMETIAGGALEYETTYLQMGAVGYHARFEHPLEPPDEAYRRFAFTGDRATMVSLYGRATVDAYSLFAEVARDPAGTLGGLGGASLHIRGRFEALVLARHFPRDFNSLHGFAFGERSGATQNETGVYTGIKLRPVRRWRVSAYYDQYTFPWLRFGVPRPSSGHDALLLVEYTPFRWLALYVQGRTETREERAFFTSETGRTLEGVEPETRQSARFQAAYVFSSDLRLRARIEASRHDSPSLDPGYGLLLYHDARWQARPWLRLDARLTLFDVDRYDARIYAYEDDLLYTFSVPAFSGRGQRTYVLARIEPWDDLELQVKLASTVYEDVRTVGSGLDEADGNRLREVRAQLRWRF